MTNDEMGTALRFDARRKEDLEALASLSRSWIRGDKLVPVMTQIHEQRLMLPRGKVLLLMVMTRIVWIMMLPFAVLRMRRPPKKIAVVMAAVYKKSPNDLTMWFKGALEHMTKGRDTYGEGSAGGWCQAELDRYVAIVSPFVPEQAMETTLKRLREERKAPETALKAS